MVFYSGELYSFSVQLQRRLVNLLPLTIILTALRRLSHMNACTRINVLPTAVDLPPQQASTAGRLKSRI